MKLGMMQFPFNYIQKLLLWFVAFIQFHRSAWTALQQLPVKPHFVFPFHVDGEEYLVSPCSNSSCTYSFGLQFYLSNSADINTQYFNLVVTVNGISSSILCMMGEDHIIGNVILHQVVPLEMVSVALDITVTQVSTEEVVYHSLKNYALLRPVDVGSLSPYSFTYGGDEKDGEVDFIEIGTSNWENSCAQAAEQMLVSGSVYHIRGTSVDIVLPYLQELPVFPGLTKVHGAITADHTKEMVSVFYVPSSVITKVRVVVSWQDSSWHWNYNLADNSIRESLYNSFLIAMLCCCDFMCIYFR
jgi:hypothetical protein